MSVFLLSGIILDTDVPRLIEALSGPEWTITDRGDELRMESQRLYIEIYDHAPYGTGREFIVSGDIKDDVHVVRSLLDTMASRLQGRAWPYRLEVVDEQGTEIVTLEFG